MAPLALSDVTYHVCSFSAPLPALAHLGCPGRCCGSSRTTPAALGLEESSGEIKKGLLGGAMNIHPCAVPFGPTLAVPRICETLLPPGVCQPSPTPTDRHGTAQDAALEVMAQLSSSTNPLQALPQAGTQTGLWANIQLQSTGTDLESPEYRTQRSQQCKTRTG